MTKRLKSTALADYVGFTKCPKRAKIVARFVTARHMPIETTRERTNLFAVHVAKEKPKNYFQVLR